jgi:hypothetical protein
MKNHPDEFERELKAMLAVDPSPGLRNRIRNRAYAAPMAPMERRRWLILAYGLTAAAAGVFLMANFSRPSSPEIVLPSQTAAATPELVPLPPVPPVEAPVPRHRPVKPARPSPQPNPVPVAQAAAPTRETEVQEGKIELPPLALLELAESLQSVPEAPVLSLALLEPINIEPFELTVRNVGVNQ